jgi:hypothetical protein
MTFFKPNKINFLPSNRVLDRKPDRVTGYMVLVDLTSLIYLYINSVLCTQDAIIYLHSIPLPPFFPIISVYQILFYCLINAQLDWKPVIST